MSSSISAPSGQWQPPSLIDMQSMLPQYSFEKLLGRGGMGAVYKAVQITLQRPVAIKVLPGDLAQDDDIQFAERFKNEALTMAKLSHPNIWMSTTLAKPKAACFTSSCSLWTARTSRK
ncbi:MAG: protein kinase domain-containing protein [Prosthecobacter sp.]